MCAVEMRRLAMFVTLGVAAAHPFRLLNMNQNDPGDALGFQQTRFDDPSYLKSLGFTGDVSTGENAGSLTAEYPSTGIDFWPMGSPARAWRDAYLEHLSQWVNETKSADLSCLFHLDMMVFPTALIDALGDKISSKDAHGQSYVDFRKPMTRALLAEQFDELFKQYPGVDGLVVRTGETYVYDNPFHQGNSPIVNVPGAEQKDLWVDFITFLREQVAVKQGKAVFFRTWDSFDGQTSSAKYYTDVMDRIPPHPNLWASVKQQAADFFRYAEWSPQVGAGHHRQIIELSAQRSWEGKGSYPNYVSDQVIHGAQELPLAKRIGLERFVNSSILQGVWVWSRGDGWWGPYLKGQELWPSLHAQTFARYWLSGGTVSEEEAFGAACGSSLGLNAGACSALRTVGQIGANATLLMRYCPEIAVIGSACWNWYRDDRMGGLNELKPELKKIMDRNLTGSAVGNRRSAVRLMHDAKELLRIAVEPQVTDIATRRFLGAHAEHGVRHFSVAEAGWRVMLHGLEYNSSRTVDAKLLTVRAIADYDAAWAAYLSLNLVQSAPSLFFDYFFNLPGQKPSPGMGATVKFFRELIHKKGGAAGVSAEQHRGVVVV